MREIQEHQSEVKRITDRSSPGDTPGMDVVEVELII
jgi:hypothetical protein